MGSGKGAAVLRGGDRSRSGKQTLIIPDYPAPMGLANVGNTCYANAALQCLLNTALTEVLLEPKAVHLFRRYSSNHNILCKGSGSVDSDDDEEALVARLARREERRKLREDRNAMQATCSWLTEELTQITKEYTKLASVEVAPKPTWFLFGGHSSATQYQKVVDPGSITKNPNRISSCLHPYQQEDAHEFLRGLLSTLVMNGHNRQLSSLFDGLLESAVTCQVCNRASLTRDRYMDLSLDISHDYVKTLPDALKEFTKTETLDFDNKVLCGKCGVKQQVTKGLRLATAPSILVCHLKRFAIDSYGRPRRLHKHVSCPLRLEIGDYMSRVNKATPPPYELVGVLVHQGRSCHSGHYLSYVKSGNAWFKTNDSVVTKVDLDTVLRQQAYIVLYEVAGMRDKHKVTSMLKRPPLPERPRTPETLESWEPTFSDEETQAGADQSDSSFMTLLCSAASSAQATLISGELCCGPVDHSAVHIYDEDLVLTGSQVSSPLVSSPSAAPSASPRTSGVDRCKRFAGKRSVSSSNLKELEREAIQTYSTVIPEKLPRERSRPRTHSFSNHSDPGGKFRVESLRRSRSKSARLLLPSSPGRRKDKDANLPPRHGHKRRHSHVPLR